MEEDRIAGWRKRKEEGREKKAKDKENRKELRLFSLLFPIK